MTAHHRRSTCASPVMYASQGIIRVFFRVLLVGLVFLGQVQQELQKSLSKLSTASIGEIFSHLL